MADSRRRGSPRLPQVHPLQRRFLDLIGDAVGVKLRAEQGELPAALVHLERLTVQTRELRQWLQAEDAAAQGGRRG